MTTPNKIDSNTTALAFAEESSLGTLPGGPVWRAVDANGYNDFGSTFSKTVRNTINASRQKLKGAVTDVDAAVGLTVDFTRDLFTRLMQTFFFAAVREKADTANISGSSAITITAVTTGPNTYTAAAFGGIFKVNDLILGSGFTNPANNGLHLVTAVAAGAITTTDATTAEAAPPAAARMQVVGVQFAAGDATLTAAASGLTLATTAYDLTTLGLTPGEWVHIGGDAAGTQYATAADKGYARVSTIAAHAIVFDDTSFAPVTDAGAAKTIRMFFGKVLRNESAANIVKKSLQFERQLGNDGNGTQSEYVLGCVGNELKLNMPLSDKIVADLSFVGLSSEYRDGTTGVKAGTRVASDTGDVFNTVGDLFRVKVAVLTPGTINPSGLVGYIDGMDLSISNGVTPNKALGKLGGFDVSMADFTVAGSLQLYFTTIAAINAVKNNSDLGLSMIGAKNNCGWVFDVPCLNIAGGRANVTKDSPIMLPVDNNAYGNPNGYTLLYTSFPYLPTVAMPT